MKKTRLFFLVGMCIAFGLVYLSPAWADLGEASLSPMASLEKGTSKTLKDLPLSAQEAVSAALGRDDPAYHISEGLQAGNAAQKLTVAFSRGTVQVRAKDSLWKLRLKGLGFSQDLLLTPAKAKSKGNRLEYVRGILTEWYINGPLGLEQGFTVLKRPSGQGNNPLTIGFSMEGDLKASVDGDKQGLWLCRQDGTKVLRYGGLRANDAAGKELATWLEIKGSQLFLRVNEAGAVYPVVIDPLVQQAELTASDGTSYNYFGWSVSLSSDGNTALIGASLGGNNYTGAAYVFVRSGGQWTQQQELTASDGAQYDYFGNTVSLSGDGNTALIGAHYKFIGIKKWQGAAYVFVRSGTQWTQQQELTAPDGAAGDFFGVSVSLSGDGNTALIGAYWKTITNPYQGAAYVFVRAGTTWSQQDELTASDGAVDDEFGYSVSLSSDGNTALIGAYGKPENTMQGAAYVFTRSGGQWTQQQELTVSGGAGFDQFGYSVSLSSDGNTALIGANVKNNYQGAAYVFVRSGGQWTQQQELTASDGAAWDFFGVSVSLSGDGNTALIGAYGKNLCQGAAYVFTRSGTQWSQQSELTTFYSEAYEEFGYSVSLSSDGNTALIGAFDKNIEGNTGQGAAYVFKEVSAPSVTTSAATNVTQHAATLNGTVNANNDSTTVTFQYWQENSYFVVTVTADQSPVTGNSNTAVSKALTGLMANTTYHYRVVGVNIAGTTFGLDQTFKTQAAVPTVTTNAATYVIQNVAALNGTVNAHNAGTTVTFQYGLTTAYGSTVTAHQSPVTGNSNTAVSKAISGLNPNTTYHFRVKGVNIAGTTFGLDQTFKTQAVVPSVTTNAATNVTGSSATLNGTVNAHNAGTTVTFQYGLTTAYGSTVTADQSPVTGSSNTAVSKAISGLMANTTYHFRIKCRNIAGETKGSDMTFKTAGP